MSFIRRLSLIGRLTISTLKICLMIEKMYLRHETCEYTQVHCSATDNSLFSRAVSQDNQYYSTSAVALSTVNVTLARAIMFKINVCQCGIKIPVTQVFLM